MRFPFSIVKHGDRHDKRPPGSTETTGNEGLIILIMKVWHPKLCAERLPNVNCYL